MTADELKEEIVSACREQEVYRISEDDLSKRLRGTGLGIFVDPFPHILGGTEVQWAREPGRDWSFSFSLKALQKVRD